MNMTYSIQPLYISPLIASLVPRRKLHDFALFCLFISFTVFCNATEAAAFKWPDFQANLEPGPSASSVAAPTPTIPLEPVAPDTSEERARFSGSWEGWMCWPPDVDLKITITKVTNKRAKIGYGAASEEWGQVYKEISARFKGDVLRGKLGKAKIFFGLREDGNLNFKWQSGHDWCTGLLNRTSFAEGN